jgi:1-acyl-sn-glycerol-3-phosphate acyltransferase
VIRSAFTLLAAAISSLVLAPLVIIARLFRVRAGEGSIYEKCVKLWPQWVLAAAGVRIHEHGVGHRPRGVGAVYISNHVGWFDVFSLAAVVPRVTFVAKRELRRLPMFGWGAEVVGIVFIDRENRKAAFESYKDAAREVENGRAIVVCPEGTRGIDYRLRPFKKGPFVLAIAAQSPIVPTVVYGAREIMAKGSARVRSGDIHVHYLPPIDTTGMTYDDRGALMNATWRAMAEALEREYGVVSEPTRTGAAEPA